MQYTVIVVPCYNEALRLDVEQFSQFCATYPAIRFLFVDDGSTDDTATRLGALADRHREAVSLLSLPQNSGKAEAVRRGMSRAATWPDVAYLGYWDADLATPLRTIWDFQEILAETGAFLAMGARVQRLGSKIARQPLRHYVGRVWATAAALTLGLAVYDTQCGAKLFRNDPLVPALFAEPFHVNWSFDVELLARLLSHQSRGALDVEREVIEVPIDEWRDVEGSKVTPLDFFRGLHELYRIHRLIRR